MRQRRFKGIKIVVVQVLAPRNKLFKSLLHLRVYGVLDRMESLFGSRTRRSNQRKTIIALNFAVEKPLENGEQNQFIL
jgi:hypothetical protein